MIYPITSQAAYPTKYPSLRNNNYSLPAHIPDTVAFKGYKEDNTVIPTSVSELETYKLKQMPRLYKLLSLLEKGERIEDIGLRKLLNAAVALPQQKYIDEAYQYLGALDEKSADFIKVGVVCGEKLSTGVKVVMDHEKVKQLAHTKEPCLFFMNHDKQFYDPKLIGALGAELYSDYLQNGMADYCPRPKVIMNDDILSTKDRKSRALMEKFGSVGVDASVFLDAKGSLFNQKSLLGSMKGFTRDANHVFIFPEGKNAGTKNYLELARRFQTGTAAMAKTTLDLKINAYERLKKKAKALSHQMYQTYQHHPNNKLVTLLKEIDSLNQSGLKPFVQKDDVKDFEMDECLAETFDKPFTPYDSGYKNTETMIGEAIKELVDPSLSLKARVEGINFILSGINFIDASKSGLLSKEMFSLNESTQRLLNALKEETSHQYLIDNLQELSEKLLFQDIYGEKGYSEINTAIKKLTSGLLDEELTGSMKTETTDFLITQVLYDRKFNDPSSRRVKIVPLGFDYEETVKNNWLKNNGFEEVAEVVQDVSQFVGNKVKKHLLGKEVQVKDRLSTIEIGDPIYLTVKDGQYCASLSFETNYLSPHYKEFFWGITPHEDYGKKMAPIPNYKYIDGQFYVPLEIEGEPLTTDNPLSVNMIKALLYENMRVCKKNAHTKLENALPKKRLS